MTAASAGQAETTALTACAVDPEQITARQIRAGDILIQDGRQIEITAVPRPGVYWFGAGRREGLAIDWRAGTASGILFRRGDETVRRVRQARPGGAGHAG
jgi:hypothetical protein